MDTRVRGYDEFCISQFQAGRSFQLSPFLGTWLGCHLIVIFLRQKQRWFSNVCYLLLWMFFYAFNPSSLS
jgi:hypothetical protein